jgi:2-polyprenyl-3-methyl-5-hydroxy-6-metoxy-1,4-benzoquinol methylase
MCEIAAEVFIHPNIVISDGVVVGDAVRSNKEPPSMDGMCGQSLCSSKAKGSKKLYKYMKNKIAESYGWKNAQPCCSQAYLEPLVLEVCRKWQLQRVLDVGTGNGSLIPSWIAQGWSVSAMEPDEEGFRIASRYSRADIRQIGVGDQMPPEWRNAFDAVISLEVVEHLFNPHQLVCRNRSCS